MSSKTIIILAFVVLVAASGVFVITRDNNAEDVPAQANVSPATQASPGSAGGQQAAGQYVDYRPDILKEATGQRVLFFHAPWCPQCRSVEKGIKEEGVPDGLTIIKVDYDSNQELRKKYGVTLQSTFVKVDGQGNGIANYVAYDEPTFAAVKRNFLK